MSLGWLRACVSVSNLNKKKQQKKPKKYIKLLGMGPPRCGVLRRLQVSHRQMFIRSKQYVEPFSGETLRMVSLVIVYK